MESEWKEAQFPVEFQAVRPSSHIQAQQERGIICEDGRNSPLQKRGVLSAREEARESRSWGDESGKARRRAQAESSFFIFPNCCLIRQLTCWESFQNEARVWDTEHCAPKNMENRHLSVLVHSKIPRTVTNGASPQSSLQTRNATQN